MPLERPLVVGFDGLHRAGKGTQAAMLRDAISEGGGSSVILRGDGTREGLGLHEGDPYSEEWQSRGKMVKSSSGNTVENWNAASLLLVKELVAKRRELPQAHDALLVDRTILSRAAFLLHRGVILEGERATLDELYPNSSEAVINGSNIRGGVPDIIFELAVPTPNALLERLETDDPKYTFRARNIRGGFHAAARAKDQLPQDVQDRIITIDATSGVDEVHNLVRQHLASTALARFLR